MTNTTHMNSFINRLKIQYSSGSTLIKVIFINVLVFVILGILRVFLQLFNLGESIGVDTVALSSQWYFPNGLWTPFTYMFVHTNLWHILFNMVMLYVAGTLFLRYFTQRNLFALYLLGGLGGAVMYIFAFKFIPLFANTIGLLIGASASVMAIFWGVALYIPQQKLEIPLLRVQVKMVYVAYALLLIDFLALGGDNNQGGHISHIGGALVGALFAKMQLRGKDITEPLNNFLDTLAGIKKIFFLSRKTTRRTRKTASFSGRNSDYRYNQDKRYQEEEIDRILDKLRQSGYGSLSKDEKQRLFEAGRK